MRDLRETCARPVIYIVMGEYAHDDAEEFGKAILVYPKEKQTRSTEADQLLASAIRFLIDGDEEDAASVLLSCKLEYWESGDTWHVGDEVARALHIKLIGPRSAYETLAEPEHPATQSIRRALDAVLPENTYIKHFTPQVELVTIDRGWRHELLEIARGQGVHNQAADAATAKVWQNLRFRSASEVRIAEALERASVLFYPNCKARVGIGVERRNRESDFLVGTAPSSVDSRG